MERGVRTAVGADHVLLVDAGDEMQGSLLSNLQHGAPTIATFNAMDYAVATFGNHEFDWGQVNLSDRTAQADYPFVTANSPYVRVTLRTDRKLVIASTGDRTAISADGLTQTFEARNVRARRGQKAGVELVVHFKKGQTAASAEAREENGYVLLDFAP